LPHHSLFFGQSPICSCTVEHRYFLACVFLLPVSRGCYVESRHVREKGQPHYFDRTKADYPRLGGA